MNILEIRKNFPILNTKKSDKQVIYFDSGTTALKHKKVIEEVNMFLNKTPSSNSSSDFAWSKIVTEKSRQARKDIALFMGCKEKEIIFTFGATLGLITVAEMLKQKLKPGDQIICNTQEHVANQLHWWKIAKEVGAVVKMIQMKPNQKLSEIIEDHITEKTKVITFASSTNSTGQKRDIKKISSICREHNIISVIDGAQHIASNKLYVSEWGVDFYIWGAHKLFSMPGLGVIYGRAELLDQLDPPFAGGSSTLDYNIDGEINYKETPYKFEYGTQNTPAIIATGKVCNWLNKIGMDNVQKHILSLQKHFINEIEVLDNFEIYNKGIESANIVMNMKGVSSSDLSDYLAHHNIATRAGDLCSKLNNFCPSNNSIRISFSIYNTKDEIDYLISILKTTTVEKVVETIIGIK